MRRPGPRSLLGNERGIALLLTLLLALLVVSLAIGVLLMMTSTTLVTRYHYTETAMSNLAAAGLEQARDALNGTPSLLPRPTGYVTLEANAPLRDADNTVIPGLTRSTYAGLTGRAVGQEGQYVSVLSVISNFRGPVAIRRADYVQRSFAAYERFYDAWTSPSNWYRYDAVFGPVHSNEEIRVNATGPRFWSRVTARNGIVNLNPSNFFGGYQTSLSRIPFPTSAEIAALQPIATPSGMVIAGDGRMTADDPELRIEFVAIDLNGDGDTSDDDEGFLRVFRTPFSPTPEQRNYVTARRWNVVPGAWFPATTSTDPNLLSPNCGGPTVAWDTSGTGTPIWLAADSVAGITALSIADRRTAIRGLLGTTTPQRRCYLGGDKRLFGNRWTTDTEYGTWSRWAGWGGTAPAALVSAIAAQGADDPAEAALTFWPINQVHNPGFRGVVYVTGSVAVSGRVRGRVTLVADGNIMIADDITYVKAPNTTCADILGLISRQNIELQDNNVNTPFRVNSSLTARFDDTPDEFVHGFLLALNRVTGDNIAFGGETVHGEENCGGDYSSSRGCRFLVGGIAQGDYTTSYNGTTGWHDQDHYDQCGSLNPPPYYPTTGSFTKYRFFEIDPVGFLPATWFAANQ